MARKNVRRVEVPESYYHVYNRGNETRIIFVDEQDNDYFLRLFQRYLSVIPIERSGHLYPTFFGKVKVHAYCLMQNHFHLIVSQQNTGDIALFMKSLLTAYSMYFNKKYDRKGFLFESSYKAVLIDNEAYSLHISRYIHLNPKEEYNEYKYSSYKYYISQNKLSWLDEKSILAFFGGSSYKNFVDSYYTSNKYVSEMMDL